MGLVKTKLDSLKTTLIPCILNDILEVFTVGEGPTEDWGLLFFK